MRLGTVEMDAMVAIMLGAGRQNVFLVERVDTNSMRYCTAKIGWLGWTIPARPRESGDPGAS
jgi:hypothetical protein